MVRIQLISIITVHYPQIQNSPDLGTSAGVYFYVTKGSGLARKEFKWQCKNIILGASLVAQWLRICLPMQGTRVRALVWEDPTYHGATKPVCHNY